MALALVLSGTALTIVWLIIALMVGIAVYWAAVNWRTSGPWAVVPLLLAVLVGLLILSVAGVI